MVCEPFLKMIQAYRRTLGRAYPKQDVLAVLAVFDMCAVSPETCQDEIRRKTGLTAGNLNKIISRACAQSWIYRDIGRSPRGTKRLSLTAEGRKVLNEFEKCCMQACTLREPQKRSVSAKSDSGSPKYKTSRVGAER